MLLFFALLTSLAFGGRHQAEPVGPSISRVAQTYLTNRPRLSMEACNGLVLDILADVGITMKGRVDTLWETSRSKGWTHHHKDPKPGDMVFWHRTYDRNRNGRVDDRFTHIGVVISVDKSHTIHMVHRSSRGIRAVRMNLHHPDTYKNEGVIYNDYLAANGYGPKDKRLSGQLFAGFATIDHNISAPPSPQTKPKPVVRPKSKAVAVVSQAPPDPWTPVEPKLRKRLLAGRGIHTGPLRDLTCRQLWAVRNAIFARHGYNFQTAETSTLFESMDWYKRDTTVGKRTVAAYLTRLDYENLERVLRIEKRTCKR
jgi:hypothetical protein